ncbi:MYCBP-associated protein-like [Pecten maximus]|uniref:MYCBP-associated protein-like n=1 Tax=Pecten maximus TaxID=6579 RepID=UPI0014582635|nr:MYCBP-associated protein-like [Pecten maximus]
MESKTSIGNKSTKAAKGGYKNKKSLMPQASNKISKQISSTGQSQGSGMNGEKKKGPPPKIWDSQLQQMIIYPRNLLTLRLQLYQQSKRKESLFEQVEEKDVVVRKLKQEIPGKTVMVLKPAPSSAEIQYSKDINYAGPRFDDKGKFISHSILGGLEDFKTMALKKGEFEHLFTRQESTERKRKSEVEDNCCGPLKTWKYHLKDWKRLQQHLSGAVSRPMEDLLMNTPDFYPSPILNRQHVHAALETMYSSHGEERKASRFWRQRVPRGDDLTGIHVTLNQSDEGKFMASEQFVDVPKIIKQEKGGIIRSYPAYYTHYLEEQESAVSDVIHILNPHKPLMEELSISGKKQDGPSAALSGGDGPNISGETTLGEVFGKDNFRKSITNSPTVQQPIRNKWEGPAVMIGSKVFKWAGPNRDQEGQTAGIVSVLFEGMVGKNILSYLEIHNVGSTVVHYEWTKNKKKGLENLPSFQDSRFYFLTEGGVMAPGETLKLPILFKASIGGIFSESWKLTTRPLLCCGANIVINLKSVTSVVRLPNQELEKVEKCLNHRSALTIATEIVEDIFHAVKTPQSPLSPVMEHTSQEESFQEDFRGMIYHSGKVKEMESLYSTILTSIPGEFQSQKCSTVAVKQALGELMSLDPTNEEDEDKCWEEACHKYDCLISYDHLCSSLLFSWPTPVKSQHWERYKIGLMTLQGAVDKFMDMTSRTALKLRTSSPD